MRIIDNIKLVVDATTEYPVYLSDVKARHPDHDFPTIIYESDIEPLGYYIVYRTARPTDGYATEINPVWTGTRYEQAWETRPFTAQEEATLLATRKTELQRQLEFQMYQELSLGAPYTFPNGDTRHILLSLEDRVNILGLHVDATRYITPTTPDPATPTLELRVREKDIMTMTPKQMQDAGYYAIDVFKTFYREGWGIEYQIETATSLDTLPVIPVSIMDLAVAEYTT